MPYMPANALMWSELQLAQAVRYELDVGNFKLSPLSFATSGWPTRRLKDRFGDDLFAVGRRSSITTSESCLMGTRACLHFHCGEGHVRYTSLLWMVAAEMADIGYRRLHLLLGCGCRSVVDLRA